MALTGDMFAERDEGPLFGSAKTPPVAGTIVRAIRSSETHDLLLNVHYAGRVPSISYAFGLFIDGVFEGCVTYGSPAASPVRTGLLGPDMAPRVLELNRLCLRHNARNHASRLIAASMRMIAPPVQFCHLPTRPKVTSASCIKPPTSFTAA